MKTKKSKKKVEWSKFFSTVIALFFGIYGIWCGVQYYQLCREAIQLGASMPDVTLAVVNVTVVISSLISYLLYQAGLKNSRNKYGVDADGQPFRSKVDNSTDNDENIVG